MAAKPTQLRILIVDDVPENVSVLADALDRDYEVFFALNGEHALSLIAQEPPDLVLLDVMMPGIDGLETLRRLRAAPWGKETPVILVTADERTETQILGLELGADDFVTKPLLLPAVMRRIRNTLARQRLQREQAQLVAELTHANAELSRISELNAVLLASAGEGIFSTDLEGHCTSMNPAALAILGFREDEIVGHHQHNLFHHSHPDGSDYPARQCPIQQTLHDGETRVVDDHFISKDGTFIPVQLTVSAMRFEGAIVGSEVLFQDISERQRMHRELLRLATTDTLTGLYNRGHFFERCEDERERARRYGHPLACLMVDLDHFKQINDDRGHAAGDAVLVAVAGTLRSLLRVVDIGGRIGGEEFAILLPQTDLAGAAAFAERLRHAIAELDVATGSGRLRVTASIGAAAIAADADDVSIEQALQRADQAMYRAKASGRNRVALATNATLAS
jgi:diguanylate cyclase (GGDEF)-like protein/PAS domain S-box-containing protein